MQKELSEILHRPVLPVETIEFLDLQANKIFADVTLGLGGHSEKILQIEESIKVIGIDQDPDAIKFARKRLEKFKGVQIFHANFSEIKKVLAEAKIEKVDGILADLGVSSLQLESQTRGFSFRFDAPLDMRMNPESEAETAADLLEKLSETEIADLIYRYGEERNSRRIARRIFWKKTMGEPIRTTRELAETVEKAIGKRRKDQIHPATRTFQALRIAVNREIEVLQDFLKDAIDVLRKNGRLAVITFHSLEDRIVKQTFQKHAGKCICPPRLRQCQCGAVKEIEILTHKPIVPSEKEVRENPRSRSAKLRVCRKLN